MTIARVQATSHVDTAFTTTVAVTLPSNPVAGRAIVVAVFDGLGTAVASVGDDLGNTYARSVDHLDPVWTGINVEFWRALNINGGAPNTITAVLATESTKKAIWVAEYSGLHLTAPDDDTAEAHEAGGPGNSVPDPGTITPVEDNELILAAAGFDGSSFDPAVGFTEVLDVLVDSFQAGVVEQIQTTATERTAFWATQTGNWSAIAVSFKAAAVAATYVGPAPSQRAQHQTLVAT